MTAEMNILIGYKTKYTLLFSESPTDLDLQVNDLLEHDWRLHGSTFIDALGRYCQAVVLLSVPRDDGAFHAMMDNA